MKNKPLMSRSYMIDTLSIGKLMYLSNLGFEDYIVQVMTRNLVQITREVKAEIEYRYNDPPILELLTILPKFKIDYKKYQQLGFDEADASLLEYQIRNTSTIITEDHPLISYGASDALPVIQLVDFFVICNSHGQVSNNVLNKLARELRNLRNITKRKHKEVISFLRD